MLPYTRTKYRTPHTIFQSLSHPHTSHTSPFKPHPSHFILQPLTHPLHITPHPSTSHTSHFTHHTSPFNLSHTPHTSHLTLQPHTSPITLSPLTPPPLFTLPHLALTLTSTTLLPLQFDCRVKSHTEVFRPQDTVYLTPDSENGTPSFLSYDCM